MHFAAGFGRVGTFFDRFVSTTAKHLDVLGAKPVASVAPAAFFWFSSVFLFNAARIQGQHFS